MSEQKITGKVIKVLDPETGTGKKGTWVKQMFIVETSDQYPKKLAFQAWGDTVEQVPNVGTEVSVSYNPESREYNDRWYTDLKAWKIESAKTSKPEKKETKTEPVKTGLNLEEESDDFPF